MQKEDESTIKLSEENVCRIAGDLIDFANENSFQEHEFLAALYVVIEEFRETGLEIEISRSKDGLM